MFVLVVVEYGGLRHCVMQPSRGCNDSKAGAGGAGATAAPAPAADRNSCRKENYSSSLSPLSSSSLAAVACQRTVDLRTRTFIDREKRSARTPLEGFEVSVIPLLAENELAEEKFPRMEKKRKKMKKKEGSRKAKQVVVNRV
ncbi:hypothetical protein HZH66_012855 [Vespula vulgaris]|uniref:Uncharacterized protein n=1 Tax=Vespula vulgaris TaxID=7454 RepID=A0A834MSE3_VESVU|nr:hypothetical protein HZH66_012855 [Vespula vulgaris]